MDIKLTAKLTEGLSTTQYKKKYEYKISEAWFPSYGLRMIYPLNAELNPNSKSQIAELFCGVLKFCACFSENPNISRTQQDKFVK